MNNTQSPNSDANKMTEEQGSQLMQLRARFDSSKERESSYDCTVCMHVFDRPDGFPNPIREEIP